MDISVIGAGRVGTALAVLWRRAGHRIVAVSGGAATAARAATHLPGVPVLEPEEAVPGAEVVVIATPDSAIQEACERFAGVLRPGASVAHASGASGLDVLAAAAAAGASTLAVHPYQTCPTVEAAVDRMAGATFAITARDERGYVLGERLALDAGGRPFRIPDELKPLYHASAVFASNYLVTVTALAEELAREAGVPDPAGALALLQGATLANIERVGPAAALTGPAVRGDALTLRRNLEILAERVPDAVRAYVVLADLALVIAERSGRLPAHGREAVEEVLARWR